MCSPFSRHSVFEPIASLTLGRSPLILHHDRINHEFREDQSIYDLLHFSTLALSPALWVLQPGFFPTNSVRRHLLTLTTPALTVSWQVWSSWWVTELVFLHAMSCTSLNTSCHILAWSLAACSSHALVLTYRSVMYCDDRHEWILPHHHALATIQNEPTRTTIQIAPCHPMNQFMFVPKNDSYISNLTMSCIVDCPLVRLCEWVTKWSQRVRCVIDD